MSVLYAPTPDLVAAIASLLKENATLEVPRQSLQGWPDTARAFEDALSIIAIWAYDDWSSLDDGWLQAQDQVIQLLNANVARMEPKAWDGYLVLLTPEAVPAGAESALAAIRSDTRSLRKLVISADDLIGARNALETRIKLRRVMAPLLALQLPEDARHVDPLSSILDRVATDETTTACLLATLSAYRSRRPLVQAIHTALTNKQARISGSSA